MFTAVIALSTLVSVATGYYLPGVSPHSYETGDDVDLYVSKLTSTQTQMPYEYYTLPYCKPKKAGLQKENIGEYLSGDRIENSMYQLEAKQNKYCEVACTKTLSHKERLAFINAIDDEYRVHWIADGLPVGMFDAKLGSFQRGFPVGELAPMAPKKAPVAKKAGSNFMGGGAKPVYQHNLNNHVKIILEYNDDPLGAAVGIPIPLGSSGSALDNNAPLRGASGSGSTGDAAEVTDTIRIVNFRVEPMSVQHTWSGGGTFKEGSSVLTTCSASRKASGTSIAPHTPPYSLNADSESQVIFTYDVIWQHSEIPWSSRWDLYLTASNPNDRVHWFSISNSILIVMFLSITIATILVRALRKDIAQYNDSASLEDAREESGWKLVHGDVFRPPVFSPMLFSVFLGSGIQLFLMTLATLFFALVGLLSPANRGSLTTGLLILYVCMGSFAGYYSSVTYKMFRGTDWRRNTILTALCYPTIVFVCFFLLNVMLWAEGSSGAVPFSTFFTILFLWLCVSVPLVVLGSFFGYKKEVVAHPVRTNQIPRAIPPQTWYMNPVITTAFGGVLPFGAVAVELYFIMSALWLHQIYYIFGFLFLVMIVLVVTCAEVAILMTYFQLCAEDYHWWWRSFMTAGACAGYMFLYSVWYNMTQLNITEIAPTIIYFTYMALASFTFYLVTGTIGFVAAFCFNTVVYGSIKVD